MRANVSRLRDALAKSDPPDLPDASAASDAAVAPVAPVASVASAGTSASMVAPVPPPLPLRAAKASSNGHTVRSDAQNARLRSMMTEHFDFVWRQLRRFGLPADAADDATQRVFIVASERIDAIEVGRERAFLFGTAMRAAMEARRTVARRRELLGEESHERRDPSPLADEMIDRGRARAQLDEVLESLELDVRAVFILYEIEELTMAEIASLLDLPVGTVASRLRRGRARFEECMNRQKAKGALR